MADLDPIQAEQLAAAMERSTIAFEKIARQMQDAGGKLHKSGEQLGKGVDKGWRAWQDSATTDMDKLVDVTMSSWDKFWAAQKNQVEGLSKRWKDGFESGGFSGGGRAIKQAIATSPVGGIMSFLLWGQMTQAEWTAKAHQATQVIEGLGPMSSKLLAHVGSQLRTLVVNGQASLEDLRSSIDAAAQAGFDGSQLMVTGFHGTQRSALVATVAMDKLFEVGSGTTAKAAAELAATTNSRFADGVRMVQELGRSARDTGMHFSTMLGTIMQITSSLRLQMNTTEDLRDANRALVATMSGFQAQGMGPQRAAQLATSGLQGMAAALQGLGPGLKAVLGEKITKGGESGLGAIRAFEQGFRGDDKAFFKRTMTEVANMSRDVGGGDEASQYQVLKQLFGMSPEAAEATIAMQKAMERGDITEKEQSKYLEELKNSLSKEGLKESTFEKMMRQLMNALANIAAGLVKILVSGFQSLIMIGRAGIAKMLGASNSDIMTAMGKSFEPVAKNMQDGWSQVVAGTKDIIKLAPRAAEAFGFRPMEDDALDRLIGGQREKARAADTKKFLNSAPKVDRITGEGHTSITLPSSQLKRGSRVEIRVLNDYYEEAMT